LRLIDYRVALCGRLAGFYFDFLPFNIKPSHIATFQDNKYDCHRP
jgi:hypothetical protein